MKKAILIIAAVVVLLAGAVLLGIEDKRRVRLHNQCILDHPYNPSFCD